MRENRIRPVGEAEIVDYRDAQDAYYPTMHLMSDLKEETGKEYELVSTASGNWKIPAGVEYVAARTDEYGIAVSPDSSDPVNIQRNYERTLPKVERQKLQTARLFGHKV